MAILVSLSPDVVLPPSGCDYTNPNSMVTTENEIDIPTLIQEVTDYGDLVTASMPAHADKMIHYSNFRSSDLLKLIANNDDCHFIRIYHCRRADFSQYTIAVPILGSDGSGRVKQDPTVKYYSNCCACNPNCPSNHGF
jgi:hypothetical protein